MENLSDISVIRGLLAKHGFNFSKALGQNFLINPSVCPKIAELGGANEETGVLEIGAGIGVLTAELARRAKKVVALEVDSRLLPLLDETLAEFDNAEVVFGDVLKLNLPQLIAEKFEGMKVVVCANLPYYITSPILMLLLESRLPLESITVMVQKEAAQRMCAAVGSRQAGAVTVAVDYYSQAEKLFDVSAGSFLPAPKVDSTVMRLTIRQTPAIEVENEKFFFKMVKAAFGQRRKTAANSISSGLNIEKQLVFDALEKTDLPQSVRAEALTMEQLAALSSALALNEIN